MRLRLFRVGPLVLLAVLCVLLVRVPEGDVPGPEAPPRQAPQPSALPPLRLAGRAIALRPQRPAGVPEPATRPEPAAPDPEKVGRAIACDARWLQAHQSPDGRWEAAGFGLWCDGQANPQWVEGAGSPDRDVGVTALALLTFLSAGYTTRGDDNPFRTSVAHGLRWLKHAQDPWGCVGTARGEGALLDHMRATLALVEVYGMTGSPLWHLPARRALDFTLATRARGGAWRGHAAEEDLPTTAWAVAALVAARRVNEACERQGGHPPLPFDDQVLDEVLAWLDVEAPQPSRLRRADLVRCAHLRVLLRRKGESSPWLEEATPLLAAHAPKGGQAADLDAEAWYHALHASRRMGREAFGPWSKAFEAAFDARRMDGDPCGPRGSFDPIDSIDSMAGDRQGLGRVGATALMRMAMNVLWTHY